MNDLDEIDTNVFPDAATASFDDIYEFADRRANELGFREGTNGYEAARSSVFRAMLDHVIRERNRLAEPVVTEDVSDLLGVARAIAESFSCACSDAFENGKAPKCLPCRARAAVARVDRNQEVRSQFVPGDDRLAKKLKSGPYINVKHRDLVDGLRDALRRIARLESAK